MDLEDQIFLKDGEKSWFVALKDIRLFESEGKYAGAKFNDQKPLVLRSLNKLEKKQGPYVFFLANLNHALNLRYVESIQPWFSGGLNVKLKCGEEIEVSRLETARFKEQMSL